MQQNPDMKLILGKIKTAWVIILAVGIVNLFYISIYTIKYIQGTYDSYRNTWLSYIIAALCLTLAFGIYRKNRVAAVVICIIAVVGFIFKFVHMVTNFNRTALLALLIHIAFYYLLVSSAIAVFNYHRIIDNLDSEEK